MNPDNQIIVAENLVKIYKTKDVEVLALQGLDLVIERGEVMAIVGNSGSGKSTLLNMIGGLDKPSAGKLYVDGKDLFKLGERELVDYKTVTVGFVWQNNARNLIPYLSALENVIMPMQFNNVRPIRDKKSRAMELLSLMGMEGRAGHRLKQLSGGEQQRVAIALALANHPAILLADEPTGNVDTRTTDAIMGMFRKVREELGTTVVIVSHDQEISKRVERVVAIRDGKTSSEFVRKVSYIDELSSAGGFDLGEKVELAVLDRAGRVQIPRALLDKMGLEGNRLHVHMDDDGRVVLSAPGSEIRNSEFGIRGRR